MGTKSKPGEFDCYHAAEPDEPMFVLLGRDPVAFLTVMMWVEFRRVYVGEEQKLAEAEKCAAALREWARSHGKAEIVKRIEAHLGEAALLTAGLLEGEKR